MNKVVTNKFINFSEYFSVDANVLHKHGVFNPILNCDTKLFVDPLLLKGSSSDIIARGLDEWKSFFEKIIKLLKKATVSNDTNLCWRQASRMFDNFHEVGGTCLGYGRENTKGSGMGSVFSAKILKQAKEIIDLGYEDPDMFFLLPLLEEGIGCDRISDMVQNIILANLYEYTDFICKKIKLQKTSDISFKGNVYKIPLYSYENNGKVYQQSIILFPKDILSDLPIASGRDNLDVVFERNQEMRNKVNQYISDIWSNDVYNSKARKEAILMELKKNKTFFKEITECFKNVEVLPYGFDDPQGRYMWFEDAQRFTLENPLTIKNDVSIHSITNQIIAQFRFLIEKKGMWKMLWNSKQTPRHESYSQMFFYSIAWIYCENSGIDVSREVDTGCGTVDFKFIGSDEKSLVEIKLSSNTNLVHGYEKQLERYKESENIKNGIYLVLDLSYRNGTKIEKLKAIHKKHNLSTLEFVDASIKNSASKA